MTNGIIDPNETSVTTTTVVDTIVPENIPTGDTNLGVIIPSVKGRKVAYAVYAGLSLVVTNVAVAFSSIGAHNPAWLTISLAVIGNLAAPFGAIAIANAPKNNK
jgi:hypothetical protein